MPSGRKSRRWIVAPDLPIDTDGRERGKVLGHAEEAAGEEQDDVSATRENRRDTWGKEDNGVCHQLVQRDGDCAD